MQRIILNVALSVATIALPFSLARGEESKLPDGYATASKLIGHDLKDVDGKTHAEIVDLLLTPTHNQVRYALVRCEKHDDKDFLVPLEAIRFAKDKDGECTLSIQPDVIAAAQSVKQGDTKEAQRVAAAEHANIAGVSKICPVSKVMGTTIVDAAGENLGEIEDLLVSTSDGSIPFAVVSTGGVLGIGEKQHVIPPAAFRDTEAKDGKTRLRIDTTKALLASAPSCEKGNMPDPHDAGLIARLNEIYGVTATGRESNLLHTSDIIGSDVRLRGNADNVGKVKDVSLDLSDGHLAFVVIAFNALPDVRDCTVAVPWQTVSYDPATEATTVNCEVAKLASKDCHVEHGVASLSDADVSDRITRHFGIEPMPRGTATAKIPVCGKEFVERDVNDTAGKGVGEIKDIAVDRTSGDLRYVAVLLDRENDKLVAVKWNELRVSNDNKPVTLLVDAPRIEADRFLKRDAMREKARDG